RLEEVSCPNGRQSSKSSHPNLASRSDESLLIANVPFLRKEQALGLQISMSTWATSRSLRAKADGGLGVKQLRKLYQASPETVSTSICRMFTFTGGPPGSRSRHLGIKRNSRIVAWCRFGLASRLFSRKRVVSCRCGLVVLQKYEA